MTSCVFSFRLWLDLVGVLLFVWLRSSSAAVWFGGASSFPLLLPWLFPFSAVLHGVLLRFFGSTVSSRVSVLALLFASAVVVANSLSGGDLF